MHFATCTRQEIDMNVQVETRLRMLEVKIEKLEKEIRQINSGIEKNVICHDIFWGVQTLRSARALNTIFSDPKAKMSNRGKPAEKGVSGWVPNPPLQTRTLADESLQEGWSGLKGYLLSCQIHI